MTQPKFSPIMANDEVRDLYKLPAPSPWEMHRPADFLADPGAGRRPGRGSAGPDQGYALLLAERYEDRVRLAEGEHLADVLRGAAVIAMRRAALYGRAPVAADLEVPLQLFQYLGDASEAAMVARKALWRGVAHDYWRERALADLIPDETLRLSPAEIVAQLTADPAAFAEMSGIAR